MSQGHAVVDSHSEFSEASGPTDRHTHKLSPEGQEAGLPGVQRETVEKSSH